MSYKRTLSFEIEMTKKMLETAVQQHGYNLRHPQVLLISQKLDALILKEMQGNQSVALQ